MLATVRPYTAHSTQHTAHGTQQYRNTATQKNSMHVSSSLFVPLLPPGDVLTPINKPLTPINNLLTTLISHLKTAPHLGFALQPVSHAAISWQPLAFKLVHFCPRALRPGCAARAIPHQPIPDSNGVWFKTRTSVVVGVECVSHQVSQCAVFMSLSVHISRPHMRLLKPFTYIPHPWRRL